MGELAWHASDQFWLDRKKSIPYSILPHLRSDDAKQKRNRKKRKTENKGLSTGGRRRHDYRIDQNGVPMKMKDRMLIISRSRKGFLPRKTRKKWLSSSSLKKAEGGERRERIEGREVGTGKMRTKTMMKVLTIGDGKGKISQSQSQSQWQSRANATFEGLFDVRGANSENDEEKTEKFQKCRACSRPDPERAQGVGGKEARKLGVLEGSKVLLVLFCRDHQKYSEGLVTSKVN